MILVTGECRIHYVMSSLEAADTPGLLHAFATLFVSGAETTALSTAHDARRRLNYSEGQPNPGTEASTASGVTSGVCASEYAARRRESGVFYDAARLVQPDKAVSVGEKLDEFEQEVQAASPINACFTGGRTLNILLSSCVVVWARLGQDGVQVCDCGVDKRLATIIAAEKDKKGNSMHGAPSCSAGYLTPQFALIAYGDGQVALVRPLKPSSSLFEPLLPGDKGKDREKVQVPLQISSRVEIASSAGRLMVNPDLDLVAAFTATAVHFLAISADDGLLTSLRSVALAPEETLLHARYCACKEERA